MKRDNTIIYTLYYLRITLSYPRALIAQFNFNLKFCTTTAMTLSTRNKGLFILIIIIIIQFLLKISNCTYCFVFVNEMMTYYLDTNMLNNLEIYMKNTFNWTILVNFHIYINLIHLFILK